MADLKLAVKILGEESASGPLGRVIGALQALGSTSQTTSGHMKGMHQSMFSLQGAMQNITSTAIGMMTAMAVMKLIQLPGEVVGTAINAYAAYERLGLSLQNLVAVGLVNAGVAKNQADAYQMAGARSAELVEWTQRLAIQSPFTQETVANTLQTAMGYGMVSSMAQDLTQALADYSAGTGRSEAQTELLGLALGQVWAKGKLTGEEMRQLTNAGMGVEFVAKAAGLSMEEFAEVMKDGEIDARKLVPALIALTDERFHDAAKKQATSWAGLLSTMSDIKNVGLREFFAGTFQAIQPYVADMVSQVSSPEFFAKVRGWGTEVGAAVSVIVANLGGLTGAFGSAFGAILDIVATTGRMIYEAMSWLNPFATHSPSLVSQVQDGAGIIKVTYKDLAGSVTASLNGTSYGLISLNTQIANSGKSASGAKGNIQGYKDLVGSLKTTLDNAKTAVQDFARAPLAGSQAWDQAIWDKQQQIDDMELQMLQFKNSGLGQDAMQPKYEEMVQYKAALEEQLRILELQKKREQAPIKRQIDLALAPKEMSGQDILAGIQSNLETIGRLQPIYDTMVGTLKDMEAAAGGVTSSVGGIGGAFAETAGNVDQFNKDVEATKKRFAELKEEWEVRLTPPLMNLIGNLNNISGWAKEHKDSIVAVFTTMGLAVAGITLTSMILNPLVAITIASAALAVAWTEDWGNIKEAVQPVFDMMKQIMDWMKMLPQPGNQYDQFGNPTDPALNPRPPSPNAPADPRNPTSPSPHRRAEPAPEDGGGNPGANGVAIHFNGPVSVRNDGDIRRIAQEIYAEFNRNNSPLSLAKAKGLA